MDILTRENIQELSEVHQVACVSIFIPTHRAGQETLEGKDAIVLKNQIKEVRKKLLDRGLAWEKADEFLKPLLQKLEDTGFWRLQANGLAIFLANGFLKQFKLPLDFEERNYVSTEFYLRPLMLLFNGDGRFYLLSLKMDETLFYEGTRHSIRNVEIKNLVPTRLEDVVGYDYEQKSLQFRTQPGNSKTGLFHGHGEGDAKAKNELFMYFREVNRGLLTLLHRDQTPPLVLACLDFHFPIYKEANTYQNLFPRHISRNSEYVSVSQMHDHAWKLVKATYGKVQKEKTDLFLQFQDTNRASSDIKSILPAALSGMVDTVFLQNHADIFGIYDPQKSELEVREAPGIADVSLMNLVAVNVFLKGGKVFLLDREEMPDKLSEINALFRFSQEGSITLLEKD